MRYSKLFGKSVREAQGDMQAASHRLLYQGGFVRESSAGRYYFLPLGMRVKEKIMGIIGAEMDKAGAQKMLSPTLHPLELWKETNRDNEAGFELMKIIDRRGAGFALGGTAEEMFVDVVRKFSLSYRDLPINLYQFSEKFRDEMRARGGLLRVREFTMKDAYSFHVSNDDFQREYKVMAATYAHSFKRMGLDTDMVPADSGYIGGDVCDEFIVQCNAGESRYFVSEDGKYVAHEDIAQFTHQDVNPDEQLKEMEQVDQPDSVNTMEDNVKHYNKDTKFFLKNVVYVTFEGDIVIVTIRGDLEVNKIKVEKLLGESVPLTEATEEDLKAIGTISGSVHSWGHKFVEKRISKDGSRECKVIYVADNSLKSVKNFIGGQKVNGKDVINVNYGRDFTHEYEGDVALAYSGALSPDGNSKLIERVGVEVGNIFQLGLHYSSKMANAIFVDSDGKSKPYYMGCYGIGIGRTLATIVEKYNDEKGIMWPISVAPYHVHLIHLTSKDGKVEGEGEKLYQSLLSNSIEVLYDDREKVSPGVKLSDADLIGIPIRVLVSEKSMANGGVEVKLRNSDQSEIIPINELLNKVGETIKNLQNSI